MTIAHDQPIPLFIRRVMPDATETELQQAAENFREYLAVILRIFERLKREANENNSPNEHS